MTLVLRGEIDEKLVTVVEKSGTINMFVNETTNYPIYQFKVLKKCLKNEKARLKMFFKVISKK